MKSSLLAGSILAGLTLVVAGCDTGEPKPAETPAKVETPAVTPGPAASPGPIEPSPVPSLPPTGKADEKKDEAKPEEKKDEAKPEEKKDEAKPEAPK